MSDETPGATDTGGQTPTDTPRGGETSAQAAGSIRDRLRSPDAPGPASAGDTRESSLTGADFRNTDSAARLRGGDERQLAAGPAIAPAPVHHELDPAAARSAERKVAALFMLSVISVVAFVAVYAFWPSDYAVDELQVLYTPLLGATMALALAGIGAGAVLWAKTLMYEEESTQERYPFGSPQEARDEVAAVLREGLAQTQLPRRSLLRNTVLLGGGALAVLPVPLLFSLGKTEDKEEILGTTAWAEGVRLIRQNGTPVRVGDLDFGGVESVFPDVPNGTRLTDSSALLIRMRPEELEVAAGRETWSMDGHIVYSSICTHLGCPVKLYEQQTHHLLCPCHQSTFQADRAGNVIFGPAARALPQLAISVDDEGYFVAQGDFAEPVGPSYWERG